MKDFVMAIDAGTTGIRVLLFDREGRVASSAYSTFEQHFPQPGWVEHDADEIWSVTERLLREVAGPVRGRIAAIGITNQRETAVVWRRADGRPIHNAIVWQCRRTVGICDELRRQGREQLTADKTGLVLDAYFSATKVQWLLEHVDGARDAAGRGELAFGTIDSWLIWKLTGGAAHVTDYTNASRTLLFNIHTRAWDDELLDVFRVPRHLLPEVRSSSEVIGETDTGLLGESIGIAGVAGDQQAALFGQGGADPGSAKNTYGTGCFFLMHTGDDAVRSSNGLITTLTPDRAGGPAFALEGSVFVAGAAIQWLRDQLGVIDTAEASEALAASVPDTAGVYLVPAFAGLGAPYWDMSARGAIVGLTRGAGRAHLVRAALESIAYQTRDLIDAAASDLGGGISELRADGGAAANEFLMQFQADMLGVPVLRPENLETTSAGAAFLAGLAVGFWRDWSEVHRCVRIARTFEPTMSADRRDALYDGWRRAVQRVR